MNLPRLTAEYAVGPAHGQYGPGSRAGGPAAAPPGSNSEALALMGQLWSMGDNNNPFTVAQLINMQANGIDPCNAGEHVCWGDPTHPLHSLDFICCNNDVEDCSIKANGEPGCTLTDLGHKTLSAMPLPPEMKGAVRQYIS